MFDGIEDEVIVEPFGRTFAMVERPGGGWVLIATRPVLLRDGSAAEPLPQPRWSKWGTVIGVGGVDVPVYWAAVGGDDGTRQPGRLEGEPLPALLLDGDQGPWWVGGSEPAVVDEEHTTLKWSIEERAIEGLDLDVADVLWP